MIVILSPAKTLEFDRTVPYEKFTIPEFMNETEALVQILKKKSPEDLANLMGISKDLAHLNYERYKEWKSPFNKKNARQCIFTFNGPVYHGFDFLAYKKDDYERLQETVRIISPLHGILRPFDLIQAHRLEMSVEFPNSAGNNLYVYWKQKVTDVLNKECKNILVNCASKEYADAVDFSQLKCRVVNIIFKNKRNGKYMVMGLLAKKARGQYADFVVRSKAQKFEDLKKFDRNGYKFDPKTSSEKDLVFLKD